MGCCQEACLQFGHEHVEESLRLKLLDQERVSQDVGMMARFDSQDDEEFKTLADAMDAFEEKRFQETRKTGVRTETVVRKEEVRYEVVRKEEAAEDPTEDQLSRIHRLEKEVATLSGRLADTHRQLRQARQDPKTPIWLELTEDKSKQVEEDDPDDDRLHI
eukprot:CAMPEP_0117578230 /NCGR_PEP_ID=MMETSP0784-20121206/63879_1 /TAXON_ID=39447 /ORGANISM="" /LENGTH=160 /DNA_ID=CAMNT_0005377853 /DNA_START=80 /DNA_END=562 /DNA_ORIENTATION=-